MQPQFDEHSPRHVVDRIYRRIVPLLVAARQGADSSMDGVDEIAHPANLLVAMLVRPDVRALGIDRDRRVTLADLGERDGVSVLGDHERIVDREIDRASL